MGLFCSGINPKKISIRATSCSLWTCCSHFKKGAYKSLFLPMNTHFQNTLISKQGRTACVCSIRCTKSQSKTFNANVAKSPKTSKTTFETLLLNCIMLKLRKHCTLRNSYCAVLIFLKKISKNFIYLHVISTFFNSYSHVINTGVRIRLTRKCDPREHIKTRINVLEKNLFFDIMMKRKLIILIF